MKNPWMMKNPFMSAWLSGANTVWGAARGRAMGEAKRQSQAVMQESARQIFDFWTGGMTGKPKRRKRR